MPVTPTTIVGERLVKHVTGITTLASLGTMYLALWNGSTGNEVSAGGYARQPVTWGAVNIPPAPATGVFGYNSAVIRFPVATALWSFDSVALFDAASGGNCLTTGVAIGPAPAIGKQVVLDAGGLGFGFNLASELHLPRSYQAQLVNVLTGNGGSPLSATSVGLVEYVSATGGGTKDGTYLELSVGGYAKRTIGSGNWVEPTNFLGTPIPNARQLNAPLATWTLTANWTETAGYDHPTLAWLNGAALLMVSGSRLQNYTTSQTGFLSGDTIEIPGNASYPFTGMGLSFSNG